MSNDKSQMYNSFRGATKDKFSFATHRKSGSIAEDNFFKWTSGNMYRTSYNDMSNKVSYILLLTMCRANPLKEKTWS